MVGVFFIIVLYVVNRMWLVSDVVCKKVEDVIVQLYYVFSVVVCLLKVCIILIIGLLVLNSINLYFVELLWGIEDCCECNGYCVIFCNFDDNLQKQVNYLCVFQEKCIDGLVLVFVGGDGVLVKGLVNMCMLIVIVDCEVEGVEVDWVQIDYEMGVYLVICYLFELGYCDIVCIGGLLLIKVLMLWVEGYWWVMVKVGLEVCLQWLLESEFSSFGGYYVVFGLLGGEGE